MVTFHGAYSRYIQDKKRLLYVGGCVLHTTTVPGFKRLTFNQIHLPRIGSIVNRPPVVANLARSLGRLRLACGISHLPCVVRIDDRTEKSSRVGRPYRLYHINKGPATIVQSHRKPVRDLRRNNLQTKEQRRYTAVVFSASGAMRSSRRCSGKQVRLLEAGHFLSRSL